VMLVLGLVIGLGLCSCTTRVLCLEGHLLVFGLVTLVLVFGLAPPYLAGSDEVLMAMALASRRLEDTL